MKTELIELGNHNSTISHSADRQWYSYAMALAIVLGATVSPLVQAQTLTVLHSFEYYVDGTATGPHTGVIRDAAGNLYGTTAGGGDVNCDPPAGCGTVFKLDLIGNRTVLHAFTGSADGGRPFAGLIRDAAGNLYGTTIDGGDVISSACAPFGCGTVFKVDATGKETVLHSFNLVDDGIGPVAGVIRDAAGNSYGTTSYGGPGYHGTLFKLDATGNMTVLYSFRGGIDGESPAAVIRDRVGNFYGTCLYGGRHDNGTVFEVDKAGKKTTLYAFDDRAAGRGLSPNSGLVAYAGSIYGTTQSGGTSGFGTVFKLNQSRKESVVHSFPTGTADGSLPSEGLIADGQGNLYGVTAFGGALNKGTVFKVDARGNETVLYNFGGADGEYPIGKLLRDDVGSLYGTTLFGGAFGGGTVFRLTP
jgi:uncharacterized repeat protein (TIGR03803 family)